MSYKQTFEDEGFVYELVVQSSSEEPESLHMISQGSGYHCQWFITEKQTHETSEVAVTDDNCEVIVYKSLEAAVMGAKQFLSIS